MHWTSEADEAVKKVPFFVRKKVRARVEEEARRAGRRRITLADVKATQKRYISGMREQVKGYQLDTCFGPSGCPNAIASDPGLADDIETILGAADLLGFLQSRGIRDLKFHHEFRVTLADCPNACSQPQIKDIGIIAAREPAVGEEACTACEACVEACDEEALRLDALGPAVDLRRCLACGRCISVCPTGTLQAGRSGYRIQLGGKLGRHPRLARELPGIYDARATLAIVRDCLALYKERSRGGERFGTLLRQEDIDHLVQRYGMDGG